VTGCPFRVLALSATPGSNIHAIQNVIRNLQIAHIDIRTDESFDVAPYTQRRTIEKVVVKLGQDIGDVQAAYTPVSVAEGVDAGAYNSSFFCDPVF